jgi:hypothetical protein
LSPNLGCSPRSIFDRDITQRVISIGAFIRLQRLLEIVPLSVTVLMIFIIL